MIENRGQLRLSIRTVVIVNRCRAGENWGHGEFYQRLIAVSEDTARRQLSSLSRFHQAATTYPVFLDTALRQEQLKPKGHAPFRFAKQYLTPSLPTVPDLFGC